MNEIATHLALAAVILFFAALVWAFVWRAAMAKLILRVPDTPVQPGDAIDVRLRVRSAQHMRCCNVSGVNLFRLRRVP